MGSMMRTRRRRRGAAMVEAVVAIPFFIIVFASMLYTAKLYGEKQRTLREAKQQAWSYALANCEGSPGSSTSRQQDTDGVGTDEAVDKYAPHTDGAELLSDWGTASATVKGTTVASGAIGGFEAKLSTTTRVQCNEKPRDGNVLGVLKFAWGLRKFW